MLKTISAALLGVAVLAAPVLAATPAKKAQAPAATTAQAPVIKADQTKSKAMNANAKLHRQDIRHGKTSMLKKKHKTPTAAAKSVAPTKPAKRG